MDALPQPHSLPPSRSNSPPPDVVTTARKPKGRAAANARAYQSSSGWLKQTFGISFVSIPVGFGVRTQEGHTQARRKITIPVPTAVLLLLSGAEQKKDRQHAKAGLKVDGREKTRICRGGWGGQGLTWKTLLVAVVGLHFLFLMLGVVRHVLGLVSLSSIKQSSTLIFTPSEIRRLWEYEILAGHYPSQSPVPPSILSGWTSHGISSLQDLQRSLYVQSHPPAVPVGKIGNPAVPHSPGPLDDASAKATGADMGDPVIGTGPTRSYLDHSLPVFHPSLDRELGSEHPSQERKAGRLVGAKGNFPYPPRPLPGSAMDMDVVMEHCNFTNNKYVRDCLEVLRYGAGMDWGAGRVRRNDVEGWRHVYIEDDFAELPPRNRGDDAPSAAERFDVMASLLDNAQAQIPQALGSNSPSRLVIPPARSPIGTLRPAHPTHPTADAACDPDFPRIFHIFWAGPFTDKPYNTLLSFLFTQNLGLDIASSAPADLPRRLEMARVCRSQMWVWINPGPAASIPNATAHSDMMRSLRENQWGAPFLHERFEEAIKFKLWNTTEQLDNIPELREHWRSLIRFDSDGAKTKPVGSTSADDYDRPTVDLSDMARFVLCHRFGGIYLDADTLLLRDWEELWGWKGQFAYRWGRLDSYNTAVLKLHRNSALGSFLFKTAMANEMKFHPMSISKYVREAQVEPLLLMLPDALFDPAWLNTWTENKQRDRPPFPYFEHFEEFFNTSQQIGAAPLSVGFDGFFRGAFSYHWHNFYWNPFDPTRNFPDLGPRFAKSGRQTHDHLLDKDSRSLVQECERDEELTRRRDLGWATVIKRTFEAYLRGERPNAYGEWIAWENSQ